MDDATAKKYYGMYDDINNESASISSNNYVPDINAAPQIELEKRQYTTPKSSQKSNSPKNNSNNTGNIPPITALPSNNYSPTKITGGKISINGRSVGDFIRDVLYYNPNNPLDPGNYADAVAIGAIASNKYAKGPLEKIVLVAGVTMAGVKIKDYLYEKFVK